MKDLDVEAVQQRRAELHAAMIGRYYRHHAGAIYCVTGVTVDKKTGELLVSYTSFSSPRYAWTRTLADFEESFERAENVNFFLGGRS